MLQNTFVHIPGIGIKREERLWDSGVTSWDAFVEPYPVRLSPNRMEALIRYLDESREHLDNDNSNYFGDLLPPNLQWRMFPEFRHATAYLDIETTGLDGMSNDITMIGLYDGASILHYVRGQNLNDFREDIEKYKVIVTYNGKCFDIPFIRNNMGLPLGHTHIDLRYVLRSVGFSGGLKGCEAQAGIDRGDLMGLDGYDAVLLWNDYQHKGNQKALETLLAYNSQDIINLEALIVMAYNFKLKATPFFRVNELPEPAVPEIPVKGDAETIERIKVERRTAFSGYGYS
jgi:uncharacterized protein YprB with RNaseH-like and TPR domain